jgi:hypothetical protein
MKRLRRDLPARIAVDAGVVDEEVAVGVFGQPSFGLSHNRSANRS